MANHTRPRHPGPQPGRHRRRRKRADELILAVSFGALMTIVVGVAVASTWGDRLYEAVTSLLP